MSKLISQKKFEFRALGWCCSKWFPSRVSAPPPKKNKKNLEHLSLFILQTTKDAGIRYQWFGLLLLCSRLGKLYFIDDVFNDHNHLPEALEPRLHANEDKQIAGDKK